MANIATMQTESAEAEMSQLRKSRTAESLGGLAGVRPYEHVEADRPSKQVMQKALQTTHKYVSHNHATSDVAHPTSSTQHPKASERSLFHRVIALRQLGALISLPQSRQHEETQAEHILEPSYIGHHASLRSPRRKLPAVAETTSNFKIQGTTDKVGHKVADTRMQSIRWTLRHRKVDPSLADQLETIVRQDASTDRDFVPNSGLAQLITQTSVGQELSRNRPIIAKFGHSLWRRSIPQIVSPSGEATNENGIRTTFGKIYQKIFAILVRMGRPEKIRAFIRDEVHDGDLPLYLNRRDTHTDGVKWFLRRSLDSTADLTCLKSSIEARAFEHHQWSVLAVSFNPSPKNLVPLLKVAKRGTLPFLSWKDKSRQGASGEVHKVEIHEDHHSFEKDQVPDNVVAVKKIRKHFQDSFDREYNILRHLRKREHANEHLVVLLAAYEQDGRYYLLLPWAKSDLSRYWREMFPKAPSGDTTVSQWILEQCCGLAGALYTIHHYYTATQTSIRQDGKLSESDIANPIDHEIDIESDPKGSFRLHGRHGDIKPENILWYPTHNGPGVLRLSDFGTARFSRAKQTECHEQNMLACSGPYSSPETFMGHGMMSVQCDVWALGCVFLEFVCWYVGGKELLNRFEDDRYRETGYISFCYPKHSDRNTPLCMDIKKTVVQMLEELQDTTHINEDERMKRLITTIRKDMLVISPWDRKATGNIRRDLGSIEGSP